MTIDLLVDLCSASGWSLADEIALEDLPEETKRLVAHALRCRGIGNSSGRTSGGKSVSLADAYDEGWEDAADELAASIDRRPSTNPYRHREPRRKL